METGAPILVLSHLRWNFVFQRPQHILTRLSVTNPIYFIEEPVHDEEESGTWAIEKPAPNITVCRPRTNIRAPGFHSDQLPLLKEMLKDLPEQVGSQPSLFWFYTPMAVDLLDSFLPSLVIYDCMDALDAFAGAPAEMLSNEKKLLLKADVMFTGGRSLYDRKRSEHHNVHCFPSSVDVAHFSIAKHKSGQGNESRPTLGFFGVIDERIDYELLRQLADARPDWDIIMVGPIVKVDEAVLPKRKNIHYLGQKPYSELPFYLSSWDVCLLPFALNDATRFISPTKTLEYMAAGKMIVGTPVADVAEIYADVVYIAADAPAFVECCERAMQPSSENEARLRRADEVIEGTSWDETVRQMRDVINDTVRKNEKSHQRMQALRKKAKPSGETDHQRVVIIGAGPTGLSAAYHSGKSAVLLEKGSTVGGWCRSINANGFTFDFAGHIMFSNDPYVHELYEMLLGENVHWQDREAWVYSKNVFTRYPFQASLYGLPPEVIEECLLGAIEARFGSLDAEMSQINGKAKNHTNGHGRLCDSKPNGHANDRLRDCCADGLLETSAELGIPQTLKLPGASSRQSESFEDFIYRVWGKGIAKHFAIPYNRKLWAVPLDEMETSWLGGRVPMPDLQEMIEGALKPTPKPMGPNARFGYPLHGGFQALMNGFLPHLKDRVECNCPVISISGKRKTVTTKDGRTFPFESLISTMPLPQLVASMGDEVPNDIREAARSLRHVSVRCVNLGVGRENITDKHWIYYPEETVFHRIFVQGNASPHCNAPGGFGLTCEITYSPQKPLPADGDELVQRCIDDCIKVGLITKDDPIWEKNQIDMPFAYVVYDHGRAERVRAIREWMETQGIILAGRYSEWEYYNSDHAFIAGKKAAEKAKLWASSTGSRTSFVTT